jgi:protein-tyrosine phosphatase
MQHDGPMRRADPYRICFVCSGNICRSPMAEAVMRELVDAAGLSEAVLVDSAGTGDWHIGERADLRAQRVLSAAGYDAGAHRARQFEPDWFASLDLVIALDRGHERTLRAWAPDEEQRAKVRLIRGYDPEAGPAELDVPDPYYDGERAFAEVLDQLEAACRGLLAQVRGELSAAG